MITLISRRRSLQTLSLAVGGALVQPSALVADRTPTVKKLGIALVGLGNYATVQLAPALLETQNCYLAGIVRNGITREGQIVGGYVQYPGQERIRLPDVRPDSQ